MQITLKRLAYLPTATLGRLVIDDETELFTVERPWKGNRPFESCIPQGGYPCRRYSSRRFPDTFEICRVPERSKILFHVANWPTDVEGCVGLGMELMDHQLGVAHSRDAMARFLERLQDVERFDLFVTQFHPEYP